MVATHTSIACLPCNIIMYFVTSLDTGCLISNKYDSISCNAQGPADACW